MRDHPKPKGRSPDKRYAPAGDPARVQLPRSDSSAQARSLAQQERSGVQDTEVGNTTGAFVDESLARSSGHKACQFPGFSFPGLWLDRFSLSGFFMPMCVLVAPCSLSLTPERTMVVVQSRNFLGIVHAGCVGRLPRTFGSCTSFLLCSSPGVAKRGHD